MFVLSLFQMTNYKYSALSSVDMTKHSRHTMTDLLMSSKTRESLQLTTTTQKEFTLFLQYYSFIIIQSYLMRHACSYILTLVYITYIFLNKLITSVRGFCLWD